MDQPNVIANRFSVDRLIGRGGMGDVYRGQDMQTDTLVAIKALKPVLADTPDLLQRFVREGEVLARLNHPNIVKILTTVEEAGRYYIIMEYVAGGSLRDLMNEIGQMALKRVLSISLELTDALTRAHHLHIIHRDIKPGNVLLAADGTPRLTDFGVAYMGDRTRITQEGALTGTYAYLSPEVCNGRVPDGRSDIWSLGVIMYEMLAGRRPFEGGNGPAILMSIINKPVPDLMSLRSDIPVAMADLIYRMLAKDPDQRPVGVRLVGAALEAILQSLTAPTPHIPLISHYQTPISTTPIGAGYPQIQVNHNLPSESTPFLGRSSEVDEVKARLLDDDCRLLTVLGQGGIGKTRLALQVGEQSLSHFVDGVYLIPFDSVTSTEFLVSTIAENIDFSFYQARDASERAQPPQAQLFEYLRYKKLLLLIDNFEHLLAGADLLSTILAHASNVKILVTSRERLNLQTEWVYRLDGMTFPRSVGDSTVAIDSYEAVQLFIQSAQRVDNGFQLTTNNETAVTRICQLVEGMPLAIELAAAWVEMLTPKEIVAELQQGIDFLETSLRDVPERHRNLHAVFEHSWNTLSRREQNVLPRLTVFRGGFDRDAAAEIADASLPILSALVNKSLLRRVSRTVGQQGRTVRHVRYELHTLLRQFAAEKLAHIVTIEQHTLNRHASFYALFLQARKGRFDGAQWPQTVDEIELEIENVRTAWQWALQQRDEDVLQQAQQGLGRYYRFRNWSEEGAEVFSQAARSLVSNQSLAVLRGRFLVRSAEFYLNLVGTEQPQQLLQEALALFREYGARKDEANVLAWLGIVYGRNGQFEQAKQSLQQSLAICRELMDQRGIARCLTQLGRLANEQGDYELANQLYQEGLAIFRQIEAGFGIAGALDILGYIAYRQGDHKAAAQYGEECVAMYESLHSEAGMARAKRLLALAATLRQDFAEAKRLNEESLAIQVKMGNLAGAATMYNNLAHVLVLMQEYEAARDAAEKCLAIAEETNNQWLAPYALSNLARTHMGVNENDLAKGYFLAALVIMQRMQAIPLILDTLIDLAVIWDSEGNTEVALSWLAMVLNHPALIRERENEIVQLKMKMAATLTPMEAAEAETNGRSLILDVIVTSLLSTRDASYER